MKHTPKILAAAAYVACIVAANYLTAHFELVPAGFGLMVTAGTYAAGLALLARDLVQDTAGRGVVLVLIVVGAALSAVLAGPQLAIASGVAFLIAETADMAVYTPLRRRGWVKAVVASNVVGGLIDTVVFLWLAGFGVTWPSVAGQMLGKAVWATLIPVVAVWMWRRVVLRQPLHSTGA